jgi:hypothetical protein
VISIRECLSAVVARVRPEDEDARRKAIYNSRPWRALRYDALKKYGGRCQACGRTANDGVTICVITSNRFVIIGNCGLSRRICRYFVRIATWRRLRLTRRIGVKSSRFWHSRRAEQCLIRRAPPVSDQTKTLKKVLQPPKLRLVSPAASRVLAVAGNAIFQKLDALADFRFDTRTDFESVVIFCRFHLGILQSCGLVGVKSGRNVGALRPGA